MRRRYLEYSPAATLRGPRRPDPDPRGLSVAQALDLLAHLRRELDAAASWRDVRNDGLVRYMLGTGARRAEAAAQTWEDVDLAGRQIRIFGKGSKVRRIPIVTALVRPLKQLWEACGTPGGALFPAEIRGDNAYRSMHPYSINMLFARWVQARLGFDISPHDLRHTFAQALNEAGVGIEEVSELLGHANITITQRYYGKPSQERLRKAIERLPFGDALKEV